MRGGEALYFEFDNQLFEALVRSSPSLANGQPKPLPPTPPEITLWDGYDVSSEGQRFLAAKRIDVQRAVANEIHVLLELSAELKSLPPARHH